MAETLTQIFVRPLETQRATVQFVDFGDGTRAGVQAIYSAHDQRWRIWILALDGAVLCGPIKLVGGVDLLAGFKHIDGVPQGELFIYSATREPPTAETIDVSALLFYRGAA